MHITQYKFCWNTRELSNWTKLLARCRQRNKNDEHEPTDKWNNSVFPFSCPFWSIKCISGCWSHSIVHYSCNNYIYKTLIRSKRIIVQVNFLRKWLTSLEISLKNMHIHVGQLTIIFILKSLFSWKLNWELL